MLALQLGMTVADMSERMSAAEFHDWLEFFSLYPFDDFSRYHRPAALVSIGMAGGDVSERLEWLQPDPKTSGMSDVDKSIIAAFNKS